jgi:hypothetical protein
MNKQQAKADVQSMHDELGDWIYGCSPIKARNRADDYNSDADEIEKAQPNSPIAQARAMRLRSKATLLNHLSACLEVLGCELGAPPMEELPKGVIRFPGKQNETIIFHEPADGDVEVDQESMVSFTDAEMKAGPQPRFKIGDDAWIVDQNPDDPEDIGFLEVVIVGVDHGVEDVHYLIGHRGDDGIIRTNYECVCAHEILGDPDEYDDTRPKRLSKEQVRAHLRVVK